MPAADWPPAATLGRLRRRAEVLAAVRRFFAERGVLEVETPALSRATVSDPHLASLSCTYRGPGVPGGEARLFLQTSPEYHMKRLLAAGSGPIYQICRAFRDGEAGALHNPEFTILEWYRPGFDHHELMDEMDELLGRVLATPAAERLTYSELFQRHLGLEPLGATAAELRAAARAADAAVEGVAADDRDGWMQLLLTHAVEPRLPAERPTFVFDYPASQAALARIRPGEGGSPAVAERFEVYLGPVELANGFHELTDAAEQRGRFEADREARRRRGLELPPLDERFLAALAAGIPDSAGVALGLDRLVALAAGATSLREVLAFPLDRA